MPTHMWRILVVEDEFDSIQMVSKILRHHHIQVEIAHNGKECLQMLNDFHPTLVVIDLAMPEMDGWETLAEIRANPITAHIPAVAITAYHSSDVADDAHQAGFDAYFPKPIDPHTFVESLTRIIRQEP